MTILQVLLSQQDETYRDFKGTFKTISQKIEEVPSLLARDFCVI